MPTIVPTPVKGYAHCTDARCSGYHQEEVDANRVETSFTVGELGGDGAFAMLTERSVVEYEFQNPDEAPCAGCGTNRVVTGEPRPTYRNESGHDPMYLVNTGQKFDPTMVNTQADYDRAAMMADLRKEMLEEVRAQVRAELDTPVHAPVEK